MALSCTPIPSDPGYENSCSFEHKANFVEPGTRGRIRPEAADIAMMHKRGTVGHLFTNPLPPPTQLKYTVEKNHFKENFKRIQSQSKKRQLEAQKPKTVHQKSTKYSSVPSKVTVFMQPSNPSLSLLDTKDAHLKADGNSLTSPTCKNANSISDTKKKNFLALNIHNAARTQVKRPPSQERLASLSAKRERELSSYQRGIVPQYLLERKEEWRRVEEERISSLPDPSVPSGHIMMPDKERRDTLHALQEDLSLATTELQALPLRCDTLHVRQKKVQLETKLSEIEDAIKIFSKAKVFIKVDTY